MRRRQKSGRNRGPISETCSELSPRNALTHWTRKTSEQSDFQKFQIRVNICHHHGIDSIKLTRRGQTSRGSRRLSDKHESAPEPLESTGAHGNVTDPPGGMDRQPYTPIQPRVIDPFISSKPTSFNMLTCDYCSQRVDSQDVRVVDGSCKCLFAPVEARMERSYDRRVTWHFILGSVYFHPTNVPCADERSLQERIAMVNPCEFDFRLLQHMVSSRGCHACLRI
jgi:hypothetical protein